MKNQFRLALGLVLCALIIAVSGCPVDGDDAGGLPGPNGPGNPGNPFDPGNPDSPNNPDNPNNPVNVQSSLNSGHDSLKDKDYDRAIEYYRAAYNADTTNADAITYSALAELAAISIDPKVQALVKDRLGIEDYPARMGALFSTGWMTEYRDQQVIGSYMENGELYWWMENGPSGMGYYYSRYDPNSGTYSTALASNERKYKTYSDPFPALALPGWFENTSVYQDSLTILAGGSAVQSTATFPLLLAANLLDKNTEGLNALLAGILDSVFGSKFEAAAARAAALDPNAEVTLNGDLIAALGLDELLEGGGLIIGKSELDVLVAGLRIVKATFEWLASYDWNADFSFAKFDWADPDAFATAFGNAQVTGLPFRNGFLNAQDPVMLSKSKADYLAALSAISSAYDTIGGRDYIPQGVRDELNNYK
ncbi:MAG: hypothetical protein LBH73_01930 [Spirochaetaceae bacterium]|nr:hypothetical protein [Spirochaetaceae bacterium]